MNKKRLVFIVFSAIVAAAVFGMTNKMWLRDAELTTGDMTADSAKNNPMAEAGNESESQGIKNQPNQKTPGDAAPVSRLADYPGFGHDIERDEEQFSTEERARENLIAKCMQANGFEYKPAPSTVIDEQAMNDPEEFERLLAEASSNPNDNYVKSLSVEMRKAYYLALSGMENPNEEEGQAHDYAVKNNSCASQAFQQIPGVYAKRNQLGEEFDAMEASIEGDKRIASATENWSNCMINEGYTFSNPKDVLRQADEALAGIYGKGADQKQIELVNEKLEKTRKISEACHQQANLSRIRQGVRIEHENQFVSEHKSQLSW